MKIQNNNREMIESEKIVFDQLLENGYPKESIIMEGQLDSRRFVDFTINDIDTGLPMMMIEVKSCSDRTNTRMREMAFECLKKYYEMNSSPIKAVAAIFNRENKKLEFIDFTEAIKENDFNQAVNDYHLPPYKILTNGAQQKFINKQKKNQQRKIAELKWICWLIIPLVCLILVLLDAFGIYTFSSLRLITIGACAAVLLIPCFKEIKIGLGILPIGGLRDEEIFCQRKNRCGNGYGGLVGIYYGICGGTAQGIHSRYPNFDHRRSTGSGSPEGKGTHL